MRKFYNEFFYIPKQGKICDRVMLTRVTMTIVIMVMCLLAMSITAYAFFSYNLNYKFNIIKSAHFETQVQIQTFDEEGNVAENSQIFPITSDHKYFIIKGLEVGKYYNITITPSENSTAKTGFVVITADNCLNTYHTQQLANDLNVKGGQTQYMSFKLMITDITNVYMFAHWGTSSYYDAYSNKGNQDELYITQGEEIKLVIDEPKVIVNNAE